MSKMSAFVCEEPYDERAKLNPIYALGLDARLVMSSNKMLAVSNFAAELKSPPLVVKRPDAGT